MEALYNNTTLKNDTYDVGETFFFFPATLRVTACIIISIGLPLTLLAICALVSLVRDGQVAPIYVTNLLVSDLIQFCCLAVRVAAPRGLTYYVFSHIIYDIGLAASLGFMVCVALERYLIIACPLWYRFRRTIKFSLVVSFMVWAFSIVLIIVIYFVVDLLGEMILLSISFLLPFPLLIFFLAGTLKALSASISVPPEEKRRIVGVLVLVLLNYTLLFLPSTIWFLAAATSSNGPIFHSSLCFIFIWSSPLVDLVLYVFMRKGAVDKLLACLCRCRMSREQEQGQINTVNDDTTERVSSV
ncbi:G-protein coupled receptor 4-like [Centroberyx affinis]|uniref:G-protein coupled receptor 4-like n=1 Tax=Centroberyx affinis TaxID=166261 RepID=UPI003A5C021D